MKYENFEDVVINTSEIEQSILNIDDRKRRNLFSWNGQFSPQFVEALLKKYTFAGNKVLDPFLGSGTTLCECAHLNLEAVGIELNPSAFHIAKIYEICNKPICLRSELISRVNETIKESDTDLLSGLKVCIDRDIKVVLILLLVLLNGDTKVESIGKLWGRLRLIISDFPYCDSEIKVYNGDARKLSIIDDTFDIVLTSPPYINVYNYHQQYRKAVEKLGYNVLLVATAEIGSNRKNRKNRFYTVIQYCIDIALAILEIIRVTKDGKRIIFVVGRSSKIMSIDFCNSKLVYDIMTKVFELSFVLRQERYFRNKYGEIIYEDILHFSNSKKNLYLDENTVINNTRDVAKSYLEQKLKTTNGDEKNYFLLQDVIENASYVKKSEFNVLNDIVL